MKIACVYAGTTMAAWSVADGIVQTLRRMGHTVSDFPRGRFRQPKVTVSQLNQADLILVSGPEHVFAESSAASILPEISREKWTKEVKPPKVGWYHESMFRDDIIFPLKSLTPLVDYHFFPAAQDAEHFDQEQFGIKGRCFWLPFGVDTEVFHPTPCSKCSGATPLLGAMASCDQCLGAGFLPNETTVDIGFIGLMYPSRNMYLDRLQQHLKFPPGVNFVIGGVSVQDVDGVPFEENARRLAMNYRKIKVFFNLPALSRLLVTKVYEVMACGTFLLTPALEGTGSEKNMDQFAHTKHLVYYRPTNLAFVNQQLNEFLARDMDRAVIAGAGLKEVREKHRLDQRLGEILEKVGIPKVETRLLDRSLEGA